MRRSLLPLLVLFVGCSGNPGKETLVGSWQWQAEDGGDPVVYTYETDGTFFSTVSNDRGLPTVRFRGHWRWLNDGRLEVEFPEANGASTTKTSTVTFSDRDTMRNDKGKTYRRVK